MLAGRVLACCSCSCALRCLLSSRLSSACWTALFCRCLGAPLPSLQRVSEELAGQARYRGKQRQHRRWGTASLTASLTQAAASEPPQCAAAGRPLVLTPRQSCAGRSQRRRPPRPRSLPRRPRPPRPPPRCPPRRHRRPRLPGLPATLPRRARPLCMSMRRQDRARVSAPAPGELGQRQRDLLWLLASCRAGTGSRGTGASDTTQRCASCSIPRPTRRHPRSSLTARSSCRPPAPAAAGPPAGCG